jgi:hypothetical protein
MGIGSDLPSSSCPMETTPLDHYIEDILRLVVTVTAEM